MRKDEKQSFLKKLLKAKGLPEQLATVTDYERLDSEADIYEYAQSLREIKDSRESLQSLENEAKRRFGIEIEDDQDGGKPLKPGFPGVEEDDNEGRKL